MNGSDRLFSVEIASVGQHGRDTRPDVAVYKSAVADAHAGNVRNAVECSWR
jgi:hypothetical protein